MRNMWCKQVMQSPNVNDKIVTRIFPSATILGIRCCVIVGMHGLASQGSDQPFSIKYLQISDAIIRQCRTTVVQLLQCGHGDAAEDSIS